VRPRLHLHRHRLWPLKAGAIFRMSRSRTSTGMTHVLPAAAVEIVLQTAEATAVAEAEGPPAAVVAEVAVAADAEVQAAVGPVAAVVAEAGRDTKNLEASP
jgi:hypothetical protein